MRKIYCSSIIILIPLFCLSQNSRQVFRSKSWQTFAYLISAAEAEKFVSWDSIPLSKFAERKPFIIFNADSVYEDKLPTGIYILVTAKGINIEARLLCISDLIVLDINNKNKLQLDVRDRGGKFISNATVFVDNDKAVYNDYSKTYWVKKNKLENAFVKVFAPGDTLFVTLTGKNDDRIQPLHLQRRQNYHSSAIYKYLDWLPSKIKQLFSRRYHQVRRVTTNGFIVFNQPKYKPLDTVKFKGYVINNHGNPYKKDVEVHLSYYAKEKNYDQLISRVSPVSPGAFVGQFLLADTIPVDIICKLIFTTARQKQIIQNRFNVEDYVLDEIGTYSFRSEKETYFKNDSLRFFCSAKDANGLQVMDGKATLLLTTDVINKYYQDTLFVKDTIYNKEISLATSGDTRFIIAAGDLPKADLTIKARLTFKNSNNEQHEEIQTVSYKYMSREILVTQNEDSIKAVYIEDGTEKSAVGEMAINEELRKPVVLPIALKTDPVASDYSFYVNDKNGKLIISKLFDVNANYRLKFSMLSIRDTLGFVLNNPFRIPVYFTVFNGNDVISTGKQSESSVIWKKEMSDHRQPYKVRWQYMWAGKEQQGEETIGLLYKALNVKINSSATVYPGQEDSIRIDVKDYKGKAVPGVNLTAVSYNNQFNKDIKVQEPPYLAKYKRKKYLMRRGYENDDDFSLTKNYLLGKNSSWINNFHLDTMAYYRLLFPKNYYHDEVTPVSNFVPQVSVNVVQAGVPQEIYLLYINRELVYYNGVTDRMKYAFEVYPGYVQIGIRLKDKFIETDSLYIQPYYKHDLSFNLDSLPMHSKVTKAKKSWSYAEMNLLEGSILQMRNDYQNNNAYLWQENKIVSLAGNREHIAGPFYRRNITFFNPGNFDINFNFEPGYQSSFSRQLIRLEKKPLFPRRNLKNILPRIKNTVLVLGDTIVPPPVIFYPLLKEPFILSPDKENRYNFYSNNETGKGSLQFTKPNDSLFAWYILEPSDTCNKRMIIPGDYKFKIKNISPGVYTLLLVTSEKYTAQLSDILVKANGTACVKADSARFLKDNALLKIIIQQNEESQKPLQEIIKKEPEKNYTAPDNAIFIPSGGSLVTGIIIDNKGKNSVPLAQVVLKGYNKAVLADASGNFVLNGLRPGKYTLIISCIGYVQKAVDIAVGTNDNITLRILINPSEQRLNEVVVTGYGTALKKALTGSVVTVSGMNQESELQGKVAGVMISGLTGDRDKISRFSIRGSAGFESSNTPLYVVDGILYDELPANLDESSIQDITVLKDAAALAIYGARAANGAIVVTTKTKTFRKQFRDYALWQPNFFTDKNGHASIPVTFPDNITGWKTFIMAIDKKRKTGKASLLTQAYKPMVAELSLPQFLIDGDSVTIIGKSKNYTTGKYFITNEFSVDGNKISSRGKQLLPGDANIETAKITNRYADTVQASFTLQSNTGFKDGEERKIPVFRKGTEEAIGNFWLLQNDTAVSFTTMPGVNQLNIYAQNNTLDLMLEELEHLRRYPYYCMEQIASKLTGLALEKKIRQQLKQPFNNQKEFDRLLQKIQKTQLFDGSWAWWENGKTNYYITTYITNALLQFRENSLVESNIRNAFLYLQNQLPFLKTKELLTALFILSNGKHEMDYAQWINKINYDSLTEHEQWQWIGIKQQQKMDYQPALKKLVDNRTGTMPGGIHWGNENYSWHSNEIATTVLAYTVLEKEPAYSNLLSSIIKYFLEKRSNGYYNNTVESATILNAILPEILSGQNSFIKPATLSITGDTTFLVNSFPYKLQSLTGKIKNIKISKTGGGLVYLTAYQQIFNTRPQAITDKFIIQTYFQKNNETTTAIKAGERIKMIVSVTVLKDADYVQMEIPIPAGCNYASKNNSDWQLYKEFYKNKLMMFTESLSKGTHQFELELEPRYSGIYTLNPAKISLMYYPVFYGRNEPKKVSIAY